MFKYLPESSNKDLIDVILRLATMAEYREGNNSSHLLRVRDYCQILATAIGLPPQEVEIIALSSQLHDVGKIVIPDSMINKADNLDPNEWVIIKSHTTIGANLLKGSPSRLIQSGETIALTHHERWNGSGYPQGLRAEEIPMSGRICAIADVFDALTTKRPYKNEISPDEAYTLMLDYSGDMFDPKLISKFKQEFREIKKISEKIK